MSRSANTVRWFPVVRCPAWKLHHASVVGPWLKLATWTAIVVLPGGLLLLPVVVADQLERRRRVRQPLDASEPA